MANELTIYDEKELQLLNSLGDELRVGGEENLDPGDIGMPPRLRISQPNRPIEVAGEETAPGVIVNTITGEYWSQVSIVPIMFLQKTRVMWPTEYNADNSPECLSDDGKHPTINGNRDVTNPQPGPCETCPMSQFVEGTKPRCQLQRNFLVWLVESNEPAILTMQSTGLKEARKLTSLAKMQGLKKSIILSTLKVKDDRGSWFVPVFSRGEQLPVSTILELVNAKSELENLVVQADTADYEVEATEPDRTSANEAYFRGIGKNSGNDNWPPTEEDEIPF